MTDFASTDTTTDGQGRQIVKPAVGAGGLDTTTDGQGRQIVKPAVGAGGLDTTTDGQGRQIVKPGVQAGGLDTGELLTRIHASEPNVGLPLYDRFADRIHDFVLFLTRDRAMAAETTRDVIVMTAGQDPLTLADPATLRAWLYAQARNETFALLGTRGRTPPEDRVVEIPDLPEDPTTADLGALVWTAMGAFSERDQALITLHLRHGLAGEALAAAMGLSAGSVDVLLPATMERVESQTAALLVLATDAMPVTTSLDLQSLRTDWDGMFSPMVRGRVCQLLSECEASASAELPRPLELLQTIPLVPAPASLREVVAERLAMTSQLGAGPVAADPGIDDTSPPVAHPAASPHTPPSGSVAGHVVPAVPGSGQDDLTIPPGEGPAAVPGPLTPVPSTPVPPTPAPSTPVPATSVAEAPAPAPTVMSRPRTPIPLAVALGIAVGLVIAAGMFRMITDDVAPAELLQDADRPAGVATASELSDLRDPLSGAAGAALGTTSTMTPTPPPAPGRLSVSGGEVVVVAGESAAVSLTNSGGETIDWRVLSKPSWVTIDRLRDSVNPGASQQLDVTLGEGLAEGDYAGDLRIGSGDAGEEASVRLLGAVEREPDLQNLQVGSRSLVARACGLDQTEVAIMVSDESPVGQVLVTATGPDPATETQFALGPDPATAGRFIGIVGPFDAPGVVAIAIEATDGRGNRAVSGAGELAIGPCAGG